VVVSTLIAALVGIGTSADTIWGWVASPFSDGPVPSTQSGELSLDSYESPMPLGAYLENHPEVNASNYSSDERGSLGVQVRLHVHLVGFGKKDVLVRVSDPLHGFLGSEQAFEPPANDYKGEVDHWAPYGEKGAKAFIEIVAGTSILDSFKTRLFDPPVYALPPPPPPTELLPPSIGD